MIKEVFMTKDVEKLVESPKFVELRRVTAGQSPDIQRDLTWKVLSPTHKANCSNHKSRFFKSSQELLQAAEAPAITEEGKTHGNTL